MKDAEDEAFEAIEKAQGWRKRQIMETLTPQRKQFTLQELMYMWNSKADEYNQWDTLGHDEIVAFAQAAHGIKE